MIEPDSQFNIPMDKRHVYDWNTRVHLLARGPGIKSGTTWGLPATQVDLAPTFLGLAGLDSPVEFDGRSLVPFLVENTTDLTLSDPTREHVRRVTTGNKTWYQDTWRDHVYFEYYYVDDNVKCMQKPESTPGLLAGSYPGKDSACGLLTAGNNTHCWASVLPEMHPRHKDCYRTEDDWNNFIAIRGMPGSAFGDTLYAEYATGDQRKAAIDFSKVGFFEWFNVTHDQWLMHNLYQNGANSTVPGEQGTGPLHAAAQRWLRCAGASCP